jgi:multidrug efflux system membrane fusion protein
MNLMNRPDLPAPDVVEADQRISLPAPPRRRLAWRVLPWLLVLAVLGGAGYALWHYQSAAPAQRGPRGGPAGNAVPVGVATVSRQDVPVMLEGLGTVQAFQSVVIRAQVDGQLLELPFTEGQEIAKGTVLARIDPRSFQAALDQALAKKAQDEALLANARLDLQRYQQLANAQGISRQQQDTQRALVAQYEAQLQADQAAIDAARTSLSYTTIVSPIDGIAGLRQVDPGNIVHPGDANGIVTIAQLRPISVVFTLPQQTLPQLRAALARGEVPVDATPPGATQPQRGRVLTMDNQVDQTTGTVKLKAVFDNAGMLLWPGAFVSVKLQVETLRDVVVVPLAAVQRGPDGAFTFVAQADGTVAQRPLVLATATGTVAVVKDGVALGERVVISGATRLYNGAAITVTGEGPRGGAGAGQPPRQGAGQGQGQGQGQRRQGGQGGEARGAPPAGAQPAPGAARTP